MDEPLAMEPFALRHVPVVKGHGVRGYVLAGHVHPVVSIDGPARLSERAACFHVGAHCMVLPAFGSFTGGKRVEAGPGERVFAVGGGSVVEVTGAVRGTGSTALGRTRGREAR